MTDVRTVDVADVTAAVAGACIKINYFLPDDMKAALTRARDEEESPTARAVLDVVLENAEIAAQGEFPYCQDTGYTVVFCDVGQDVHFVGGDLTDAINEGIRRGYAEGFLRGSIVATPLWGRKNTGDNTPGFIHTRIVPGDRVRIQVDAKGGGSENKSRHVMLVPADGEEGVRDFVIETVKKMGPDACPPGIIGVGIGGNFELSAELAKRALLRHPVGAASPDPQVAEFEQRLLTEINDLGLGPQSLGGRFTTLAVHVETFATHIASLPVAVNTECHAHRTTVVEI
jgi:fumarate hydratase subunit alpha